MVFTGDWVPDHELARRAGLVVERDHPRAPHRRLGTDVASGVVAVGNLVHPGETAGLAALGGRDAARRLAEAGPTGRPRCRRPGAWR